MISTPSRTGIISKRRFRIYLSIVRSPFVSVRVPGPDGGIEGPPGRQEGDGQPVTVIYRRLGEPVMGMSQVPIRVL